MPHDRRPSRLTGLLLILAAVAAFQLSQHLVLWYAHRDDRALLRLLREELVEAGAEMVAAQLLAERLRAEIGDADRALASRRGGIDAFGRHAQHGVLPTYLYSAYRRELDEFNDRVQARNRRLMEYRAAVLRRNRAAERYNLLADSMRSVAARARDPYHPIPIPAEAALERGIVPAATP